MFKIFVYKNIAIYPTNTVKYYINRKVPIKFNFWSTFINMHIIRKLFQNIYHLFVKLIFHRYKVIVTVLIFHTHTSLTSCISTK